MTETAQTPAAQPTEAFSLTTSRHFPGWLARMGVSLAFTTYQAGKVFLLGLGAGGRVAVFNRSFTRCMGLGAIEDGRGLILAAQFQVIRFDDVHQSGQRQGENDRLYAPHVAWITGDVDAHDVAAGADGRPIFVNTLFSCIAEVSERASFRPLWRPPFISRLAAEDRCHLNGMAVEDGRARYVTCVARSDVADGWRERRADGGLVIDVQTGETVVEGLSMPHSPRMHEGRLWLLNSGTGELGWVDPKAGRFEPIAFCPGFARGLAFVGGYALVGLSLPRENRTFSGLPLDDALSGRGAEARCGIIIIDLATGDLVEWVRIEGVVRELFDVAVLPGTTNPGMIGFKADDVLRVISIDKD